MRTLLPLATLICALCNSCAFLDSSGRSVGTLFGVQDGSAGDLAGSARPLLRVEVLGQHPKFGTTSVLGIQVAGADYGSLNDGDATTDLSSLGVTSGLRFSPETWQQPLRFILGVGLALQYLELEGSAGRGDDTQLGIYGEAAVIYEAWSLVWRRLGNMDMDLGPQGQGELILDQFMVGWSTGF